MTTDGATSRLVAVVASLGLATIAGPARADTRSCITASENELLLRKQGHLRDALQQLAVCADSRCPVEVRTECARRIDDLRSAVPTLILSVKDTAGSDVLGVRVTLDGAPLANAASGTPVALDPGEHTLSFERAGEPSVERKLVLHEGEQNRRETIVLPRVSALPGTQVTVTAPTEAPGGRTISWNRQKTLSLVAASVGVAGIGVGAGFGVAAIASQKSERSDCPQAGCAEHAKAVADYDAAHRDSVGSTIAFGAGAAFIAAGVVLWLTAPAPAETREGATALHLRLVPMVSATTAGLSLGGDL